LELEGVCLQKIEKPENIVQAKQPVERATKPVKDSLRR
jgi:hypothetical protein